MRIQGLTVLLMLAITADAQKIDTAAIGSIFRPAANENRFSGVVLIASKGNIAYEQAFGYRDYSKQIPLQQTDVFELASVSKQFTAMVIMMLKEKGLLQYDDLLEKYINIPYKGITIRHLLTHSSGLPDYQEVMDRYWDKSKVAGNPDIIEYLNRYAPPALFKPGTKYTYSNTGYVMLASVAEKASGRDFIDFCKGEIFQKLGMQHTAIRTLAEKKAVTDFALGHIYITARGRYVRADSFPSSDYTIWLGNRKGPGRISSTAEDLLKWDRALYSNKLIKQQTLDEAFTPMRLADGSISNYGFGWMIIQPEKNTGKIVWHSGDNPGYKTEIKRFLDSKRTLIILCNNGSASFEELSKQTEAILRN